MMKINFTSAQLSKTGALVVFATQGGKLSAAAEVVDKASKGQLIRAIKAVKFEAKRDSILDVIAVGPSLDRVLIVGLGKVEELAAREICWR